MFKKIKKIIELETIKIVSFGVFRDLLIRPTIDSADIFQLLSHIVKKKYNIGLLTARLSASNELDVTNTSLSNIYNFIAKQLSLDEETKLLLEKEELTIERTLLNARKNFKELYDVASKIIEKL